jgi:hypothetical protein
MGAIMGMYDSHIPSFQQNFNLRFGPQQVEQHDDKNAHGGIVEMKELQSRFEIFHTDKPFHESCRALGIGGDLNNDAKRRWFKLLKWLKTCDSDKKGMDGDQRIVTALVGNLEKTHPLPCFMTKHDGLADPRVLVFDVARPLHYIEKDYLTISLPLAAKEKGWPKRAHPQKKRAGRKQ